LNPIVLLVLAGFAFVVVEMTATWIAARRLRNFGIVDVVWSFGFAPLILVFLGFAARRFYDAKLDSYPEWSAIRACVLAAMGVLWSVRLGFHLFVRVKAHHPVEDVRYAKLRTDWGAATDRKMYGFFLLQGALQVVLALPFVWVCLDDSPAPFPVGLGYTGIAGIALWITGLVGESIADAQLARFRGNPANKGKVCQDGLWAHSRHPNYFFEWLVWVGYAVFATGAPWGWLAWLSPLLMFHFLVNVTGIPMTEELSVKSKGDAYRLYQRTTNAFFPGPRRRATATPA
jgi:steroid 5-alpha reductase family enzyme